MCDACMCVVTCVGVCGHVCGHVQWYVWSCMVTCVVCGHMCGVWYTSVGVCSGIRGHLWFCVWVRGTYMCLHVLACLPSGEGIVWFCCMCVQCYVHILKLLLLHRSCSELILGGGLSSPRSALLADTRPKAPCAWEKLGTRGWVGPSEEDNQQRLAQIPNALKASIEFEALLFINSGKNVALRAGALVPYITQAPGCGH